MNEPIHKNCIAERDWLRREYERLTAENAKYEAARKVADAAVAAEDARNAIVQGRCGDGRELTVSVFKEMVLTNNGAQDALNAAITEYRQLTEGDQRDKPRN